VVELKGVCDKISNAVGRPRKDDNPGHGAKESLINRLHMAREGQEDSENQQEWVGFFLGVARRSGVWRSNYISVLNDGRRKRWRNDCDKK